MNKFGRNYELTVQANGGGPDVVIKPPFSIDFDVQRHRYSTATISVIRIYNLSENTRNKLRKNSVAFATRKKLTFRAGYGDELSTLLVGNVMIGSSVRVGTDFVTTLQVFDGGYAYANATVPATASYGENTPYKNIAVDLIKSLKDFDVAMGSIGKLDGKTVRGASFTGSTINNLDELTDGRFFIDNGVANILNPNEVLPAPLQKINSSSGLLNTPEREETFVNIEMLFEPKILCGQKIELESSTGRNFSGVYQVISLRHRGMISEAVGGDCTTNLQLRNGVGDFSLVYRNEL